jgi:hypothetical protein
MPSTIIAGNGLRNPGMDRLGPAGMVGKGTFRFGLFEYGLAGEAGRAGWGGSGKAR